MILDEKYLIHGWYLEGKTWIKSIRLRNTLLDFQLHCWPIDNEHHCMTIFCVKSDSEYILLWEGNHTGTLLEARDTLNDHSWKLFDDLVQAILLSRYTEE